MVRNYNGRVYQIEIRPTVYTPHTELNPRPPTSSWDEICEQTRDYIRSLCVKVSNSYQQTLT